MNEVRHFVANDNESYGYTVNELVHNYLKSVYPSGSKQGEVVSLGDTYKFLVRDQVTVFYDESGNTLFDVSNERLQSEYEWVIQNGIKTDTERAQEGQEKNGEPAKCFTGKSESGLCGAAAYCGADHKCCAECTDPCNSRCGWLDKEEKQEDDLKAIPDGTASPKESEKTEEVNENAAEEVVTGTEEKENVAETGEASGEGQEAESGKKEPLYVGVDGAVKKLQDELKKASAKDKQFAEPCIEFLINRCNESESFAEDVCQDHKTWEKCYKYIFEQAKKKLNNVSGPVRSDTVFEWAEDYFHLDDKAAEEKKAKEAAERKKKAKEWREKEKTKIIGKKDHAKKPAAASNNQSVNAPIPVTETKPQHKPKKNEMNGQMDLFSLMGNM